MVRTATRSRHWRATLTSPERRRIPTQGNALPTLARVRLVVINVSGVVFPGSDNSIKQEDNTQRQEVRRQPSRDRDSRDGLHDSDDEKIEVGEASKLLEQKYRYK